MWHTNLLDIVYQCLKICMYTHEGASANKLACYLKQLLGIAVTHPVDLDLAKVVSLFKNVK